MLGEDRVNSSVAQRLWVAAQPRGGAIMLTEVSEADIARGKANGWLRSLGVGRFEVTEELRKSATCSV